MGLLDLGVEDQVQSGFRANVFYGAGLVGIERSNAVLDRELGELFYEIGAAAGFEDCAAVFECFARAGQEVCNGSAGCLQEPCRLDGRAKKCSFAEGEWNGRPLLAFELAGYNGFCAEFFNGFAERDWRYELHQAGTGFLA